MSRRMKTVIMGAAGRDFHNFNVFFRKRSEYEVVAFTASQIPGIERRTYPPILAGPLYPKGIQILPEEQLPKLIKDRAVELVVLAYSDLSYDDVMHKASMVGSNGPDFMLMGPNSTMLKAKVPVVSVCAVRTGAGKTTVSRAVSRVIKARGKRVIVVRHPMPYGELETQAVQRFATYEDMDREQCTIEEREEYEPHIDEGNVVYAGVDYERILLAAEKEADVILWDGGNNDLPFYKPNLHVVVADPHRAGDELSYYPGETNVRMADVIVVNKVDSATPDNVRLVRENIKQLNPTATIVEAASAIHVDDSSLIKGKSVLVVEDGPTVTHGQMRESVGAIAAHQYGARELVNPRPFSVGSIKRTYEKYPHIGFVLPAMGYGAKQIRELEQTIERTPCDSVVLGTPVDIRRIVKVTKPAARVRYEMREVTKPGLEELLRKLLK
ncbi:cyclic 2,3-diphosphoglycerate synthase [[Eubacterium] cellulosolvens]